MRDLYASQGTTHSPAGGATLATSESARAASPVSSGLEFTRRWRHANVGMSIAIRPARKRDAGALARFYESLSPRSRLQRFHGAVNQLPAATVARFAENTLPDELTLLAVLVGGASEAIVGEARYCVLPDGRTAEFAVSIADAAQGIGLGRRLVQALVREASAQGIERLRGDVMPENETMLALARSFGFEETRTPGDARLRRVERDIASVSTRAATHAASTAPAEATIDRHFEHV